MYEVSVEKSQLDTARGSTIREIERLDGAIQGFSTMQEQVDQLCALVRVIRERIKAGLSPETKRKIIDLLDASVRLSIDEGERKIAEVVCRLTLDEARLLVGGVGDEIVTATGSCSGTRWSGAP
jgi:hypothetical protein